MTQRTRTTTWSISDEHGWSLVARNIIPVLKPGSILALQGPLGAGKTTFVQALAKELGALRVPKSPTFSLLRTYAVKCGGIRRLLHVDAYRIHTAVDLIPLDLDAELSEGDAVLVLEWPENVTSWLRRRSHRVLRIDIKKGGRTATLSESRKKRQPFRSA
jgi:tRNA threonylcarbamoyl adenosine modification protein YjeE